jgi:DNA-binding NtrC family response regulator
METKRVEVLLIGESPQGSSYLTNRLQGRGCDCEFVTSYQQACATLRSRHFDLVLSPMRLSDRSVFPLIDFLEGAGVTLFYSQAVEEGCWWLPALRCGQRCFGSSALRPGEFMSALDEAIEEIRSKTQAAGDPQRSPVRHSTVSVFVTPASRQATQPMAQPRANAREAFKHKTAI